MAARSSMTAAFAPTYYLLRLESHGRVEFSGVATSVGSYLLTTVRSTVRMSASGSVELVRIRQAT